MKVSALLIAGMATVVLVEASRLNHKDIAKVPTEGNHKSCDDSCGESASSYGYETIGQQTNWCSAGATESPKMVKILDLIREACSLNRLDILLEVASPVEWHGLNSILDSFLRFKKYNDDSIARLYNTQDKLCFVMKAAAEHGHLPIIRFLWPAMGTISAEANYTIESMMTRASANNHQSVLEFLMQESGEYYIKVAQNYVNNAFEAAVREGHVGIIEFLTGDDNAGNPVAPGLGLTKLNYLTLHQAIVFTRNWSGIKCLVDLKQKGDSRFADFELVDRDNTALCMACGVGEYELVEYLLCRTVDGEFVFPLTTPAAKDNQPLISACRGKSLHIVEKLLERDLSGKYIYQGIDPSAQKNKPLVDACHSGCLPIVEKLLERDVSGSYIYKGIDPSAQDYQGLVSACSGGRVDVVKFLLKMEDGKYVLPGMEGVNFTRALLAAIHGDHIPIVEFLLTMNDAGVYVLPGIRDVRFKPVLGRVGELNRIAIAKFLLEMKDGKYLLPGITSVDLTFALSVAIENGSSDVVEKLLERDASGNYIYKDLDLLSNDYLSILAACYYGHVSVVEFLFSVNEFGEYVLPRMNRVNMNSILLAAIKENQSGILNWLLRMNKGGEYVLPGMNSVDFTRVLSTAIYCDQMGIAEWLLSMKKGGEYVLPGMNSVDLTRVLSDQITFKKTDGLKWLLSMNESEEYVLPGMDGVDFTRVLSSAIEWNRRDIVEWLLRMNKGGKYVLPGMNGIDLINFLSDPIRWRQMDRLKWLLSMNKDGEYVLPGMNGVDFTRALLIAIRWNRMEVLEFLLAVENAEYVLPGMEGADLGEALVAAIEKNRMEMVRSLLQMNYETYVLPGMNGVDFTRVLSTAIKWEKMDILKWLLRMNEGGEYVLPRIRVTEDMLTIFDQSLEMTNLLEERLEQQRMNA